MQSFLGSSGPSSFEDSKHGTERCPSWRLPRPEVASVGVRKVAQLAVSESSQGRASHMAEASQLGFIATAACSAPTERPLNGGFAASQRRDSPIRK